MHMPNRDEPDLKDVNHCDIHGADFPLDAGCPDCFQEARNRELDRGHEELVRVLKDIARTRDERSRSRQGMQA